MKNLVQQSGRNITVTAPADVASGAGVLVGSLFGVASSAALSGKPVVIDTGGVYALAKATGSIGQGAKVYWDNTAKNVTTTSSSNTLIGVATAAAASGDATVNVRLGIVA